VWWHGATARGPGGRVGRQRLRGVEQPLPPPPNLLTHARPVRWPPQQRQQPQAAQAAGFGAAARAGAAGFGAAARAGAAAAAAAAGVWAAAAAASGWIRLGPGPPVPAPAAAVAAWAAARQVEAPPLAVAVAAKDFAHCVYILWSPE